MRQKELYRQENYMDFNDLQEADIDIGYMASELIKVQKELKTVKTVLNAWETLSVDDMIFTANCISAAGVKNYREFLIWREKNPTHDLYRNGNEVRIVKTK